MNIDGNNFEYTGENINLLDSIEIDDLYLDNNENNKNKHINYIPYKGKNLRDKLYDMHSTKNLRINTNEKIKKKSSSKPKPKINNSHFISNNNNIIDAKDILNKKKEIIENEKKEEIDNENKTNISKNEINPRIQRLYEDYNKRIERQKKLKTQYDNEEINKYPYTPQINKKSRQIVTSNPKLNIPIQKRTNDIIQETNEKISNMKNNISTNPTFNPKINNNTNNNKTNNEESVFDRLYESKNGIQTEIEKFIEAEKNIKNRKRTLTKEEKECSFHPQTYSNMNDNSQFDLNQFIERQNEYLFQSHSKMYNLKKKLEKAEKEKLTFNPDTSYTSTSNAAIKIDVQRQGESLLQKLDRMTYEYVENKEKLKQNLDSYYNNFSFTPEINYNYNGNYILKNSINLCNKSFSHYPKKVLNKSLSSDKIIVNKKKYVNHKYDYVVSKYFFDNDLIKRIDDSRNKKIIDNLKKREEKEMEELKECTFAPKINKNFDMNIVAEKNNYSPIKGENTYTQLQMKKISYESNNNMNNNYIYNNFNNSENYNVNNFY